MDSNSLENKVQYILDENGNLTEMLKSEAKVVDNPIKYRLKNAFEVFVLIQGTENYWISNYGRCVNNHRCKNSFYKHKQGKVHYTIYDVERISEKNRRGVLTGRTEVNRYRRETTPEDLVADTFLKQYRGRCKIWNKDGDYSNNWYKNLLYVTNDDYKDLKANKLTWQELNYEQEYMEYENKASHEAMKIYNANKVRCSDTKKKDNIGKCYDDATMCQLWLDDPKEFVKWYLEHYYEVEDESMSVDKDLFGAGSKLYSPDTCCILPQGLNTLLTNCKKRYLDEQNAENTLPLGVRYSGKTGKYRSQITFTGSDRTVKLSEWDTQEDAFAEYKIMKQADILLVAAQYKESIPDYIYDALLKVKVNPY